MANKPTDDSRGLRDKIESLQTELRDATRAKDAVEARAAKLEREVARLKSATTKRRPAVVRKSPAPAEADVQYLRATVSALEAELARLRRAEGPPTRAAGPINAHLVEPRVFKSAAWFRQQVAAAADRLSPEQLLTISITRRGLTLLYTGRMAPEALGTWRLQHTIRLSEESALAAASELPVEKFVAVTSGFEGDVTVWFWEKVG